MKDNGVEYGWTPWSMLIYEGSWLQLMLLMRTLWPWAIHHSTGAMANLPLGSTPSLTLPWSPVLLPKCPNSHSSPPAIPTHTNPYQPIPSLPDPPAMKQQLLVSPSQGWRPSVRGWQGLGLAALRSEPQRHVHVTHGLAAAGDGAAEGHHLQTLQGLTQSRGSWTNVDGDLGRHCDAWRWRLMKELLRKDWGLVGG